MTIRPRVTLLVVGRGVFETPVLQHEQPAAPVLQLLADLIADADQRLAVGVDLLGILQVVVDDLPRQMLPATRRGRGCGAACPAAAQLLSRLLLHRLNVDGHLVDLPAEQE